VITFTAMIAPSVEDSAHTILLANGNVHVLLNVAWIRDAPTPEAYCDRVLLHEVLHILDPELDEDRVLAAEKSLLREVA
jgi:hypothetical protein